MGTTEYRVVNLLAGSVEGGNAIVGVLGRAVALDGLMSVGAQAVQTLQEVRGHHVVGIQNDGVVKTIGGMRNGVLQCLGLGASLENGFMHDDGLLAQPLVGGSRHVVGNDGQLEKPARIVLPEKGFNGMAYHAVFMVGREEHHEAILAAVGSRGMPFLREQGRESKEGHVGHRDCQDSPERKLQRMNKDANHA